ncbi:MAG: aldehyde dehydrogenase family protein, partial [Chloroflexi bacterium]|nr:aldehyde dehydrogenase family protein [Chloroflexota bacterium]
MEAVARKEKIVFTDGELISYNPATFEENGRVRVSNEAEVREAVARARGAFPAWAELGVKARSGYLHRLADLIYQERAEIARIVSQETGKPRVEGLAHEVLIALADIHFLTREAPKVLKPQRIPS